ncbi:MAG: AAA family ATPase, partial [Nitrososphaerota archaeon]
MSEHGVRKEVQLKVAEARQRDIGRKIARVDSRALRELNLSPGDLVEITGKRTTIAIVWPPYKEDDGMGLVRIDGEVRRNAGVSVGEYVRISKANAKPATKIVLAPFEPLPFVGDFARIVKSQLMNLPVMKGDTVVVPILGMGIELKVTSTSPTNA